MSEPSERDRDYDVPVVWHGGTEFDASADRTAGANVPVGGLERCDMVLPATELDASHLVGAPSGVALSLTFHFDAGAIPTSLTQDVLELLDALHEYDKSLGGQGLSLNRSLSRAGEGCLTVVLRPNERKGAWMRLQQMAEQLGVPAAEGPGEVPTTPSATEVIADVISQLERRRQTDSGALAGNGSREPPHLRALGDCARKYRMEFQLIGVE
jgi:hypothetical protein